MTLRTGSAMGTAIDVRLAVLGSGGAPLDLGL